MEVFSGIFNSKRKKSDMDSDSGSLDLSPKRPLRFHPDTPDWAKDLFRELLADFNEKLSHLEITYGKAIDFATETANMALADAGQLRQTVKGQSLEIAELRSEVAKMRLDQGRHFTKMNNMENQSRRDNLLFYNFKEQKGETDGDCKRQIYDLLTSVMGFTHEEMDGMRVVRCHRKGPYQPGINRPIIIKMHWFRDREEIWSRRSALRGTSIILQEDFSDHTESQRRIFYPVLKAARSIPKYKNKVSLKVDKLYVEGKMYTTDQIDALPDDLQPAKICTETKGDLVKFFRKASPLSNFHHSPIKIDNTEYHSVEQYYQCQKAKEFDDDAAAGKIMKSRTPFQCFKYGQTIDNFDQAKWRSKCDAVMKKGLEAKFTSCEKLCNFLLSTDKKVIAECNGNDTYWSIGYFQNNPCSDDKSKWKGQNKLGYILMEVRDKLRTQRPSSAT